VTAEELLRYRDPAHRLELVRGELRRLPFAHANEGLISASIMCSLGLWAKQQQLGDVLAACGFILDRNPDTVRAPDIAFIRKERTIRSDGYFPGAPDLAIEVIAVSDTYPYVMEKIDDWLRAGATAVIVVVPEPEIVSVYRAGGSRSVSDVLEVDDVVSGWKMPLAEIFEA
jgi:Uma2 family endonuclease